MNRIKSHLFNLGSYVQWKLWMFISVVNDHFQTWFVDAFTIILYCDAWKIVCFHWRWIWISIVRFFHNRHLGLKGTRLSNWAQTAVLLVLTKERNRAFQEFLFLHFFRRFDNQMRTHFTGCSIHLACHQLSSPFLYIDIIISWWHKGIRASDRGLRLVCKLQVCINI